MCIDLGPRLGIIKFEFKKKDEIDYGMSTCTYGYLATQVATAASVSRENLTQHMYYRTMYPIE